MTDLTEQAPPSEDDTFRRKATTLSVALLALALITRAVITFTKAYAQDDFYWWYFAWLRSTPLVPGRDYYLPNVTPLSELAAPLFRWCHESFLPFDIARVIMFAVGLALTWACYQITRLLGGSVLWSVIAANGVSWQYQFLKRIGDIRGDQISMLFLMLAVIVLLKSEGRRRALWSGFCCGASVAVAFKLTIAAPFVGIGLLLGAEKRIRDAFLFALTFVIAPTAYFGSRIAIDGYPNFASVFAGIFNALDSAKAQHMTVLYRFFSIESAVLTSPLTWAAVFAGGCAFLLPSGPLTRRRRAYVVLATGFVMLFVYTNVFLFPYNYVILVPSLIPFIGGVSLLRFSRRFMQWAAVLVPISGVVGGTYAVRDVLPDRASTQRAAIRWIWSVTDKNDAIFDWQGTVAWRPTTYHWMIYSGAISRYESGWFTAADEMQRAQVKMIVDNYRVTWISERDTAWAQAHFARVNGCILVPGWVATRTELQSGKAIDAFLENDEYVLQPSGTRGVLIDGKPVTDRVRLTRGPHELGAQTAAELPPSIALVRMTAKMVANPMPCTSVLINPAN